MLLGLEARGVGGMRQHRRRQVRPPDRLAGRAPRLERCGIDLEAELAQAIAHPLRPQHSVLARVAEALAENRVAVVDAVAQNV